MKRGWTIEQRKAMFSDYLRNPRAPYCPLDQTQLLVRTGDTQGGAPVKVFSCTTCKREFQSNEVTKG